MNRKTALTAGSAAFAIGIAALLTTGRKPAASPAGMRSGPEVRRPSERNAVDAPPNHEVLRGRLAQALQPLHEIAAQQQERLTARLSLTAAQQIRVSERMTASVTGLMDALERSLAAGSEIDPEIIRRAALVRGGAVDPDIAALLTPAQLEDYEALAAAERHSQGEAIAMRQLANLGTAVDDLTPEQRDAAYRALVDTSVANWQPSLNDVVMIKTMATMDSRTPDNVEGLRSVLNDDQLQRYTDFIAGKR